MTASDVNGAFHPTPAIKHSHSQELITETGLISPLISLVTSSAFTIPILNETTIITTGTLTNLSLTMSVAYLRSAGNDMATKSSAHN